MEELERTIEPSWPKLVEPLEKIVDRLNVVWGMINHLKAVKDTPELRAAIEEVQVDSSPGFLYCLLTWVHRSRDYEYSIESIIISHF